MRLVSWNIRNIRALDHDSCWWRRREAVAGLIRELDADVWSLQEAYPAQVGYLARGAFGPGWRVAGRGRNAGGGGEACAIWVRTEAATIVRTATRWFGPQPDRPGSRLAGARFPRIVTFAELAPASGGRLLVANTHLDEASAGRRRASTTQLVSWLPAGIPTVVLGDLNAEAGDTELRPLIDAGLRPVLAAADGPTSGSFGGPAAQIDHGFIRGVAAVAARVERTPPARSDHWPVVVDLAAAG